MKNATDDALAIGSLVEWDSQANGGWKRKQGKIISVNTKNGTAEVSVFKIAATPVGREKVNFKKIKEKLYRPRLSALRKIGAENA